MKALMAAAIGLAAAAPAAAAPEVVTDIPPVHSLAAQIMAGVGEPSLLLPPGASPHGYAMRPSEAALLEDADIVVWVGGELTPWLGRAIGTVAADAVSLELLDAPGAITLGFREGATFEVHDHAHDHDHGHDHAHEGVDPHAWLDPENGKVWLDAIAETLAAADPGNAATYLDNAATGKAELDQLSAEIAKDLEPLAGRGFVVFHDAYHYFEARFGIEATGAISLGDAADPSPARVAEIRDAIRAMDAGCVFSEPQFQPRLVATVVEGTGTQIGELDPLGAELELGASLYSMLLSGLRDNLVDCLGS